MYYCENCRQIFERAWRHFAPFPEYGGEYYTACPYCGAPEMYREYDQTNNKENKYDIK